MRSARRWLTPALLCVGLAVVHTWPLATAPASLSSNDNADAQLNEWILAWVAHTLPRAPWHLFQGNIFYPSRDVLAFSEPLLVPALLGAPIAWIGGSPVLVFNLVSLAGLALSALAAYALMYHWTGDRAAALLSASIFAFNVHTLGRLAHVQAQHIYGLPLALLSADRLMASGRRRDAAWLALWMTTMAYTSGYLAVFGVVLVGVALVARMSDWLPRARAVLAGFATAAALAALAAAPLVLPYRRAAAEQGMVRSLADAADFSASPAGYLAAPGTIHAGWSARFFTNPVDGFFPGFLAILLALAAIVLAVRGGAHGGVATRRRIAMLAAIAVAGFVLSLGTRTPVYGWLYRVFPPMHGLRAAARFGNLFLLGVAGLAGFGLAALRSAAAGGREQPGDHAPRRRSPYVLLAAAAVVVGANVEATRAPFTFVRFAGIPPLYRMLSTEPHVVLAEVPFYPRQAVFENAEYVLNSTAHWRPLMNGYSGYTPASYSSHAAVFWYFPREHAVQAMRSAGVTHVMVHPDRFGAEGPAVVEELARRTDFELAGIGPRGLRLYRLH